MPAASYGLFSLRPTHGRIPVDGVVPLAPPFDVVGLLARRPEVLAAAFGVLAVPEPTAKLRGVLLPGRLLGPADAEAHNGYGNRFRRLMADDAVLVVPVIARRGPRRAWSAEELLAYRVERFRLTAPSSLTGAPQVVLPVSTAEGDATAPAAIVGWRGCDDALLALARSLAAGGERVVL